MFLSHRLFLYHHQSYFGCYCAKVTIRMYRATCTKTTSGVHSTSKVPPPICPGWLLSNSGPPPRQSFTPSDLDAPIAFWKDKWSCTDDLLYNFIAYDRLTPIVLNIDWYTGISAEISVFYLKRFDKCKNLSDIVLNWYGPIYRHVADISADIRD